MLKNLPGAGEVLRGVTDNPKHQIFYDSITDITEDYIEIDIPILAEKIGTEYLVGLTREQFTKMLIHYIPPEFIGDYIFSRSSVLYDLRNYLHAYGFAKDVEALSAPSWSISRTKYIIRSKMYKKNIRYSDLFINLFGIKDELESLSNDEKNKIYQDVITDIRVSRAKKYETMKKFYIAITILYINFIKPAIFDWDGKFLEWIDRTVHIQYPIVPLNYVYIIDRSCTDPEKRIGGTPLINIKDCGIFTPTQLNSLSKYILSVHTFEIISTANEIFTKVLKYIIIPLMTGIGVYPAAPAEIETIKRNFIINFKLIETYAAAEEHSIADKMESLLDSGEILPGWKDKDSFHSDLDNIILGTRIKTTILSFMREKLDKIQQIAKEIGRKQQEEAAVESERQLLLELEASKPTRARKGARSRRRGQKQPAGKQEFIPAAKEVTAEIIPPEYAESCKYPFAEGKQEDDDNKLMIWLRRSFSHYKLDNRVTRWRNKNTDDIRRFRDKDKFRYAELSDSEIHLKRTYHHLPGTDLLLRNKAYAFDTPTGKGLIVSILRDDLQDDGVIYFGIDKDGIIFHRFFEPPDDDLQKILNHTYDIFVDRSEDNTWECNDLYVIDINEDGIVEINYPSEDYGVRVYPIREDLILFSK